MAKQLSILDDGTFSCNGLVCPLFTLYKDNAECADCPIVKIHEELKDIDYCLVVKRLASVEFYPKTGE